MFVLKKSLGVLALALVPLSASAVQISDLFNTGVDNGGSVLANGAIDSHYTIIAGPLGAESAAKTADNAYPFGYWLANDSNSAWVGPNTTSAYGYNAYYTYRTTFTVAANAILSSVAISGLWGTDDVGVDIFLNGSSTGQSMAGFYTLAGFSLNSNFQVGTNTLDFLVLNSGGGPTGLRVDDMTGSYATSTVPEGSFTLVLIGASMIGLVTLRRKLAK